MNLSSPVLNKVERSSSFRTGPRRSGFSTIHDFRNITLKMPKHGTPLLWRPEVQTFRMAIYIWFMVARRQLNGGSLHSTTPTVETNPPSSGSAIGGKIGESGLEHRMHGSTQITPRVKWALETEKSKTLEQVETNHRVTKHCLFKASIRLYGKRTGNG